MNLRVLKLFCWINWPINSFCTMSFCLIFRLPSQILAFIRGLPDFFVFCFNRLPSVSINFYLSFCEKNLVLPFPSLTSTASQLFSPASQLTSPASQKSKDSNNVLLLLQDLEWYTTFDQTSFASRHFGNHDHSFIDPSICLGQHY